MRQSIHPSEPFIGIVFASLLIFFLAYLAAWSQPATGEKQPAASEKPAALQGFFTNESIIAGLNDRSFDLEDSIDVFRRVLASFSDTVTMRPSENYYYFGFYADGRMITGSMSLFPHERDSAVIGFGYTEKRDRDMPNDPSLVGGWGTFGAADGVQVERIENGRFRVSCAGRSVVFNVASSADAKARLPRLRSGESVVLRNLDESGVPFALVLDRAESKLFWVLDESRDVPETFAPIGEEVVVGSRTRFAFYDDVRLDRKVLIGVEGFNVLGNTWFDGPFDQISDNDIERGTVNFKDAISVAYPQLANRIDRFGKYTDNPSTRIAIAPYLVYFSVDELLGAARACREESPNARRNMSCLTQQIFIVPDNAYAAVGR